MTDHEVRHAAISSDVVRMYVLEKKSLATIGEHFRHDSGTIRWILVDKGVTIRGRNDARAAAVVREQARLQGRLRQLHADGLSIREIADKEGLTYGTARRRLIRAGVTMRPRGYPSRETPIDPEEHDAR